MTPSLHLWLIAVLPLIGAAINGLLGRRFSRQTVAAIALGFCGATFVWVLFVAARFSSLTLMSSGPGALTGPRAAVLSGLLAELDGTGPVELRAEVERIWKTRMEPEAVAGGVPAGVIDFLRTRMLQSSPTGLRAMGEALLACPDRTPAVAKLDGVPLMVVYGENDDAWEPAAQEDMAARLGAQRVCIPAAAHSPAVEAPETTASTLTGFWNSVECHQRRTP